MKNDTVAPESTAARVALWRAMHLQVDDVPHIIEDQVGLTLLAPDSGWRERPDMHVEQTKPFRASIVGRARFVEDLVVEQIGKGIEQYVLLGAGLDTFAQRRAGVASKATVFEIDQAGPQIWKKHRLAEAGFGVPDWLKFVAVNFESGDSWFERLKEAGFDPQKPAVISCTGVTLYLTKEAVAQTLHQVAMFAPGSTLAMTFLLPIEMADPEELPGRQASERGAKASGTPFVSFFTPDKMVQMAREAGFASVEYVGGNDISARYFAGRKDGLKTGSSEAFIVAKT